MSDALCPCESGKELDHCCGPFLRGDRRAPTAEALMRSRFAAFSLKNARYLLETWHPSTRPPLLDPETFPEWSSLQIIRCSDGREQDQRGTVEFVARFRTPTQSGEHHEVSRFTKQPPESSAGAAGGSAEQWFYEGGQILPPQQARFGKVGRNAPCPCGSGKKFKKCCGR